MMRLISMAGMATVVMSLSGLRAAEKEMKIDIERVPAPMFTCPVFEGAADPTAIWNKEKGEWWVFYTQRRANQQFEGPVAYCYGCPIGIAVSKDQGRTWTFKGSAELPQDRGMNTFWAPHVFTDDEGVYHMIVTYLEGVRNNWGGDLVMKHFKSKNLEDWEYVCTVDCEPGSIDASVYKMPDGTWKMWYKNPGGKTATAISKDLKSWKATGKVEIDEGNHEAPVVFEWKGKYWNIVDPCDLGYVGLKVYESENGSDWKYNNDILNKPGRRKDDNDQGRHADVRIVGDRAFLFYFTHPGRVYDGRPVEIYDNTYQYRRSSLQMAELEYKDGKIICDRDKYAR